MQVSNWILITAALHHIWILTRSKMKQNPFNLVIDYESLQTSQTNSNHWKLFHFKQIRDHVKLQIKSESLHGLNRSGKLNLNHFSLLTDLGSWQKNHFNHSKLTINHICDYELLLRMRCSFFHWSTRCSLNHSQIKLENMMIRFCSWNSSAAVVKTKEMHQKFM